MTDLESDGLENKGPSFEHENDGPEKDHTFCEQLLRVGLKARTIKAMLSMLCKGRTSVPVISGNKLCAINISRHKRLQ